MAQVKLTASVASQEKLADGEMDSRWSRWLEKKRF